MPSTGKGVHLRKIHALIQRSFALGEGRETVEMNITVCVLSCVQSVGEPVSPADASLGEHLAPGGHLPVHVPPLPHPLCGASACEFHSLMSFKNRRER